MSKIETVYRGEKWFNGKWRFFNLYNLEVFENLYSHLVLKDHDLTLDVRTYVDPYDNNAQYRLRAMELLRNG